MNILQITNGLGFDGTARAVQVYCKYLNRNKFNIYTCGFMRSGPREQIIKRYVKDVFIAGENVENVISFIQKNKIEVLHWFSDAPAGFDKDKVIKLLTYCNNNNIKVIETSIFVWFDEDIDKLVSKRIFISQACLTKFLYKFGSKIKEKNKYSFLYIPVDLQELKQYQISQKEIINLKNKLGIRKDDFVIGKVGRADIWKWSDQIIDVVPYLVKEIPNLKVVIRAIPEVKIQKIKNKGLEKYFILLPGNVSEKELFSTYQLLDVFINNSRVGEAFGTVLAEAMYFGKPIITDNTDFRQFTFFDRDNAQVEVVQNKKNGFVVNSVTGMANKIIYLNYNNSAYRSISKANKNRVKDMFEASKIVEEFGNIINGRGKMRKLTVYDRDLEKDSFFDLVKINIKTIFEYLKYMKFNTA